MNPLISVKVLAQNSTFMSVGVRYRGHHWSYSVSGKSVDAEGWDQIANMILEQIASDLGEDRHEMQVEFFTDIVLDLGRQRPPKPKVQKIFHHPPKAKHTPPTDTKPPLIVVPLPMAIVRKQQAKRLATDFLDWLCKLCGYRY